MNVGGNSGFLHRNPLAANKMVEAVTGRETNGLYVARRLGYSAVASTVLRTTQVMIPGTETQFAEGPDVQPARDASYWAEKTKGWDWSSEDKIPADLYNRVLWEGLTNGSPYPTVRTGLDLSRKVATNPSTGAR